MQSVIAMNCHKLIYKPIGCGHLYEQKLRKYRSQKIQAEKELLYNQILSFKSSRYPAGFIDYLENRLDPLQYSLEKITAEINSYFPGYPKELVNESIEYIYRKKMRQNYTLNHSQFIIEDGEEYIRNGRMLMKEDFSYFFPQGKSDGKLTSRDDTKVRDRNTSRSRRENRRTDRSEEKTPERNKSQLSPIDVSSPEMLNSKSEMSAMQVKNEIFNEILSEEIKREARSITPIELYEEDTEKDILELSRHQNFSKLGFEDNSARDNMNDSALHFKERDIVVQPEGMETGRSEFEELQKLLSEAVAAGGNEGDETNRSANLYSVRINTENMDNLYTLNGNIKLGLVRRAITRMRSGLTLQSLFCLLQRNLGQSEEVELYNFLTKFSDLFLRYDSFNLKSELSEEYHFSHSARLTNFYFSWLFGLLQLTECVENKYLHRSHCINLKQHILQTLHWQFPVC